MDTTILLERRKKPERREDVIMQVLKEEGRGHEPRNVGVAEPSKGTSPSDSLILAPEIHFGLLASKTVKE